MLSEIEIDAMRTLIKTGQLVYRDVDGGVHTISGYSASFKERPSDPDEVPEPVFFLTRGGCIATDTVSMEDFFFMEPIAAPAPTPSL